MKTNIKRTLSLLLSALMIFGLTACSGDTNSRSLPSSPVSEVESTASVLESSSPEEVSQPEASPEASPTAPPSPGEVEEAAVNAILDDMSLEEMMSQMFMLRFSNSEGYFNSSDDPDMISFVQRNMPGGYVLFTDNITTVEETGAMVNAVIGNSQTPPFIAIDEEGGIVSRLASAGLDGYEPQPTAADIGAEGDPDRAYQVYSTIGRTLASIGVNVDFAPDADVLTNPDNEVIGSRSFGGDQYLVADMVASAIKGLKDYNILTAAKHFPGHGGTTGDSHDGSVYIDYDTDHLESVEYIPFQRAIEENSDFILVGHILVPNVDDSNLPASLSPYFVTDVLRNQLGYDGMIVTDAMDMGAVADNYSPGEGSVLAVKAGVDVVLIPDDYEAALEALQAAVDAGEITEKRIRDSAYRIILAKYRLGLFS